MKNIKLILSTLFLTFLMLLIVQTETNALTIKDNENNAIQKEKDKENHQQALKQETIKKELMDNLKERALTIDDLEEEGGFHFTENDKAIIELKESPKEKIKHGKLKKIAQNLSETEKSNFAVETVPYSQEELETLTANWFSENQDIYFTEDTVVKYDYINNRVDIKTNQLSNRDQEVLSQRYGSKIYLDVDPSFENKITYVKSREADWNKLGSGIGIKFADGDCSTAGIAKKDTRYFIITAGHCVGTAGIDNVYQWNSLVGKAHVDARSSGYDFGLVLINKEI